MEESSIQNTLETRIWRLGKQRTMYEDHNITNERCKHALLVIVRAHGQRDC